MYGASLELQVTVLNANNNMHTIECFQVLLSNIDIIPFNNDYILHRYDIWFEIFKSNTNNFQTNPFDPLTIA